MSTGVRGRSACCVPHLPGGKRRRAVVNRDQAEPRSVRAEIELVLDDGSGQVGELLPVTPA